VLVLAEGVVDSVVVVVPIGGVAWAAIISMLLRPVAEFGAGAAIFLLRSFPDGCLAAASLLCFGFSVANSPCSALSSRSWRSLRCMNLRRSMITVCAWPRSICVTQSKSAVACVILFD